MLFKCKKCGENVRESASYVETLVRLDTTCYHCGGKLTPVPYIPDYKVVRHLMYMDICTVMMYENPGLSMAAANLANIGRLIFDIHVRYNCEGCANDIYTGLL